MPWNIAGVFFVLVKYADGSAIGKSYAHDVTPNLGFPVPANANLSGANLSGANLNGANQQCANLSGVIVARSRRTRQRSTLGAAMIRDPHSSGSLLIRNDFSYPWTPQGYGVRRVRPKGTVEVLTPRHTVSVMTGGFTVGPNEPLLAW